MRKMAIRYQRMAILSLSKKYYFFDKGISGLTAAHAPSVKTDGAHVCRPRSIFSAAHVA